jgi:RND family efflux transporter MFP subunit
MMKQMKRIMFAFALAAFILNACAPQQDESVVNGTDNADAKKEVVRVMELQMQTVARSVEYPGTLEAYEEVHMVPAQPGRIENIFVDVSDRVTKGTPLVQMDKTQLHQAEVQLQNLKADFNRLDTLKQYGSVAQQQYDQVKTQYEVAKSNVEFLRENTQLLAPFNGVVSGRYFEPGEMYSGAPNTLAGKAAVLSIVQIDRLKGIVPVSEKHFPKIEKGMETKIKVDIYPGKDFTGRVERVHPTIDPANRTFNVEMVINNREGLLRPGMFARAAFNLDEEEVILLPNIAVLKLQGSNERYLFKVENGVARRVSVTIGERYDDNIEVFSDDLEPGDNIIVSGQARLVDGAPVQVVEG